MSNLEKLISPSSIAIIGASENPQKIGYQLLNNIITSGFTGQIFPVNIKGGRILDLAVYKSVIEIEAPVDLAILVIPATFVLAALLECARKKIPAAIVISAGFAETGTAGLELQNQISQICKENNITLLGPNCLGLINCEAKLNASFAGQTPLCGNVSFVSQSGAMISALIDWSKTSSIGFSKIFSLGNKALLAEADLLHYLYKDASTAVVIFYLEQLLVTPELTAILAQNAKKKPTVVLFGGKTAAGAQAAASHTGALVSSYLAIETYLKQSGVIVAEDLEDLFVYTTVFSTYNKINGNRVAIVTNAGGPSIASSDAIVKYDLKLAEIPDSARARLREVLRPEAPVNNPIDVLGDATDIDYKNALEVIASDPEIDAILVLLTPQSSTKTVETARHIIELSTNKPIISAFIGGESVKSGADLIKKAHKVTFAYPEMAVKAIKALVDFSAKKSEIGIEASQHETFSITEKEKYLKQFDLPVLEYIEIENEEQIIAASQKIGYPVVLKTARKDISHKSDTGGVKLNLKNQEELLAAFTQIGAPAIVGKMVKGKHEIFLGIKKDQNVGTVIAFGTGGIYSEVYKDLSYRIAPISSDIAKEMILETKMGAILAGARGQKAYNMDRIANIIVNTAKFADNFDNISELDFNPMIADENGEFYLVDARIITIPDSKK